MESSQLFIIKSFYKYYIIFYGYMVFADLVHKNTLLLLEESASS